MRGKPIYLKISDENFLCIKAFICEAVDFLMFISAVNVFGLIIPNSLDAVTLLPIKIATRKELVMIDPRDVTKYDRDDYELEEFMLFCIIVASKIASIQARKLDKFINLFNPVTIQLKRVFTPFGLIRNLNREKKLEEALKKVRLSPYKKLIRCFSEISEADLNLRNCKVQDLEKIYGIGPKTARYFIMHSRKGQRIATLDRHILQWLRELGHDVPKSTPTSTKYKKIEALFLKEADQREMLPEELDLQIWKQKQKRLLV